MKISRQRHQLLIAWQADGDSCIGSPNFKCCNSATPTRRRRRPRCEIAYVSYKTWKYLSGYAKKRKRKSRKRKQINWLRFALSKRDRGAKRLGNLVAAVAASAAVVAAVVVLCGWQITVAKTVENSIKLRANNRRRSILVDVVYIILLFAITEKQRQAQQCHNNNSRNTQTHAYTHTHSHKRTHCADWSEM